MAGHNVEPILLNPTQLEVKIFESLNAISEDLCSTVAMKKFVNAPQEYISERVEQVLSEESSAFQTVKAGIQHSTMMKTKMKKANRQHSVVPRSN